MRPSPGFLALLVSLLFTPPANAGDHCLTTEISRVGNVPILTSEQSQSSGPFYFVSGLMIDADGSPQAYHPDDTGLDALDNAGSPEHWWALVTDSNGEPVIQRDFDPAPGYYVSTTALEDFSVKDTRDPDRYVDSVTIPYISLPPQVLKLARLGDFAMVINLRNGNSAGAIIADVGPRDRIGEGSIALARKLGVDADARRGGTRADIMYLVFPGSGDGTPVPSETIHKIASEQFDEWGGSERLATCSTQGSDHVAAMP